MTTCTDCKYQRKGCIANDVYILAGIHGLAISIEYCPMRAGRGPAFDPGTMTRGTKDGEFAWVCKDCGVPTVDKRHELHCPHFIPFPGKPQPEHHPAEWVCDEGGDNWTCRICGNSDQVGHGHLCPFFIPPPAQP